MDGYSLGKDIQAIFSELAKINSKINAPCSSRDSTAPLVGANVLRDDVSPAATPQCRTAIWYGYNLQVGGGMGTVTQWARSSMEESNVTDITVGGTFVSGIGPDRQDVWAFSQNLNCDPPGSGVGIPCFVVLSVADPTSSQAFGLRDQIVQRLERRLGID